MKPLLAAIAILLLVAAGVQAATVPAVQKQSAESKNEPTKEETSSGAVVPKSLFETSTQYRDPFHPRSSRRVKSDSGSKNEAPPPDVLPASYLVFNGFSGQVNKPLAIINGRTFAAGEEGDVVTDQGKKVKIRCLEIRTNSVIIAVGAEGVKTELRRKD